jgi:hypothetical protein
LFFGRQYGSSCFQGAANGVVKKFQFVFAFHEKWLDVCVQTRSPERYFSVDRQSDQVSSVLSWCQNQVNFLERVRGKPNHSFVNESLRSRHPPSILGRCRWVQITLLKSSLGYLLLTYRIALCQTQIMKSDHKSSICRQASVR